MKRSILLTLIALILIIQGCSFPQKDPIEETQNILIGGIDIDGDNIVLTVYVDKISASGKSDGEQISYKLYTAKGKTIYEADNCLHGENQKHLSWFHTKYIIVGEDAARQGVDKLFSFFTEDDETRLLYKVAIAKGMSAKEFLQFASASKDGLGDYLDNLFDEVKRTGKSREVHLLNYAIDRETSWNDAFMPALEISKNSASTGSQESGGSGGKGEESEQEYLIKLIGFALFNGDKLCGFLEGSAAFPVNILNNEAKGAQVTVTGQNGHSVSLQLMQCKTDIKPVYNPLLVKVDVSMDFNLVDYHDGDNPLDNDFCNSIEEQINEQIKNNIADSIKYMQSVKSDAVDFGDKFYHSNPYKWQGIKDDWRNLFPQVSFNVNVDSNIKSTYEFKEPINGVG